MNTADETTSGAHTGGMAPIVPPKEEPVSFSARLPPTLVKEIDDIAEKTGRSRNSVMEFLLRWAIQESKRELEAQAAEAQRNNAKRKTADSP
jgi:predicted transcriptional regulator